jgi:sterol desaturase/sphingolipid hydroxylase (fatty acid hydroxylase superfamily)
MGNIFSFWDALAGTRYLPERREALDYGLAGNERAYRNVWELYWRPFVEIWQRLSAHRAAAVKA